MTALHPNLEHGAKMQIQVPNNKIMKIIIYEDDDKLRQSLSLLINGTSGFDVVGTFNQLQ